jgi:hypothetical protein
MCMTGVTAVNLLCIPVMVSRVARLLTSLIIGVSDRCMMEC